MDDVKPREQEPVRCHGILGTTGAGSFDFEIDRLSPVPVTIRRGDEQVRGKFDEPLVLCGVTIVARPDGTFAEVNTAFIRNASVEGTGQY